MQIVTFRLAGECYGLPIESIHEIIMDQDVTNVPNLPSFLKGIIHLRQSVIPIVDGMERLGYEQTQHSESGRILIVEYDDQLIGVRVSAAEDVLNIDSESIQDSPELINEMGGRFVNGVIEVSDETDVSSREFDRRSETSDSSQGNGKDDDSGRSILLLDLEKLFTGEEIEKIREARREHGEDSS